LGFCSRQQLLFGGLREGLGFLGFREDCNPAGFQAAQDVLVVAIQ